MRKYVPTKIIKNTVYMNAELPERCGNFPIFTYPYIDKSIQCKVLGYIVYLERPDILHAARKQEKKPLLDLSNSRQQQVWVCTKKIT